MISVIIPVYDEVENLKRLLPVLVRCSEGHQVEIIISAGVCTADYSFCTGYSKNIKVMSGERKGRAYQMNKGATIAKGDIFAFLHADVLPPKQFFKNIKETLSDGYDAGFFSYRFDKANFFLKINASFTKRKGIFTGGGDQCLFIKKSTFEQLGRFNEKQVLMEDFEFFKRMQKGNVPYQIVNNDLVVSARKYSKNSYLRVNFSNLILVLLFKFNCAPKTLGKIHGILIK